MRPLLLLSALLLTACPGPTWTETFDGSAYGALSGVWGSGPEDVWIVGGTFEQAQILHFDGSAWTDAEAPAVPLLAWVYGWGPDDAISVGVDGAAARWDGSTWTALDTGTDEDLWGVFGFSRTDVWIVGGNASDEDGAPPVILHYDGSTFTPYALPPEQNSRGAVSLFKVWGTGDLLFALGQDGLILQHDGSDWLQVPAGAQADQDWVSLWGTGTDEIVAVGGRSNARVGAWDGSSWTSYAPSGFGGLNAVSMVEPDLAVVGGINGTVGTFAPSTGELTFEDTLEGGDVHAIWHDGEDAYYAVGGRFNEPLSGLAWTRSGG